MQTKIKKIRYNIREMEYRTAQAKICLDIIAQYVKQGHKPPEYRIGDLRRQFQELGTNLNSAYVENETWGDDS